MSTFLNEYTKAIQIEKMSQKQRKVMKKKVHSGAKCPTGIELNVA